jgi:hypothetical protein
MGLGQNTRRSACAFLAAEVIGDATFIQCRPVNQDRSNSTADGRTANRHRRHLFLAAPREIIDPRPPVLGALAAHGLDRE